MRNRDPKPVLIYTHQRKCEILKDAELICHVEHELRVVRVMKNTLVHITHKLRLVEISQRRHLLKYGKSIGLSNFEIRTLPSLKMIL